MTDPAAREQALANYRALLAKVDAKFAEILTRQRGEMRCARGCHACCKPGLTVNALEAAHIRGWLAAHPEARAQAAATAAEDPHRAARCSFLTADGACSIYEARPVVCRSHGAPLAFRVADRARRDVCPLNFGGDAGRAPEGDVINLDLLNSLLTLMAAQFGATAETEREALAALATAADH